MTTSRLTWIRVPAVVLLLVTACSTGGGAATATEAAAPVAPAATSAPPSATSAPPTETAAPATPALPAEPQRIEFQAADGTNLVGLYYPAAVNPAPVVVLMNMVGETKESWKEVPLWLQNRQSAGRNRPPKMGDDLEVGPLPPPPAGFSVAVFAFDWRGHGESAGAPNQYQPEEWLLDADAAVRTAQQLPGVDPDRVITMGASIGGDGAVDVCRANCAGLIGAVSLSPGSFLDIDYHQQVKKMGEAEPKLPVLCQEGEDEDVCDSAPADIGDHYQFKTYAEGWHGQLLFREATSMEVGQDILDFLVQVLAA